jgi:hypothetical protein
MYLFVYRLDIFLVYSLREKHIFVLIRASLQKLCKVADEHQVKMLLNEEKLKAALEAGNEEKNIAPVSIAHDPNETEFRPCEFINGRFRNEVDRDLYWRPDDISHPFRESVRLKLTLIMIELPPPGGGSIKVRCEWPEWEGKTVLSLPLVLLLLLLLPLLPLLPLLLLRCSVYSAHLLLSILTQSYRKQLEKGNIAAFFPLHHLKRKQELSEEVLKINALPWNLPLFRIKVSTAASAFLCWGTNGVHHFCVSFCVVNCCSIMNSFHNPPQH